MWALLCYTAISAAALEGCPSPSIDPGAIVSRCEAAAASSAASSAALAVVDRTASLASSTCGDLADRALLCGSMGSSNATSAVQGSAALRLAMVLACGSDCREGGASVELACNTTLLAEWHLAFKLEFDCSLSQVSPAHHQETLAAEWARAAELVRSVGPGPPTLEERRARRVLCSHPVHRLQLVADAWTAQGVGHAAAVNGTIDWYSAHWHDYPTSLTVLQAGSWSNRSVFEYIVSPLFSNGEVSFLAHNGSAEVTLLGNDEAETRGHLRDATVLGFGGYTQRHRTASGTAGNYEHNTTFGWCDDRTKTDTLSLPDNFFPAADEVARSYAYPEHHAQICSIHQLFCTGENAQYASVAECVQFLNTLPGTCTNSSVKGNTVGCRALHGVFTSVNPWYHCPHMGKNATPCEYADCPGADSDPCSYRNTPMSDLNDSYAPEECPDNPPVGSPVRQADCVDDANELLPVACFKLLDVCNWSLTQIATGETRIDPSVTVADVCPFTCGVCTKPQSDGWGLLQAVGLVLVTLSTVFTAWAFSQSWLCRVCHFDDPYADDPADDPAKDTNTRPGARRLGRNMQNTWTSKGTTLNQPMLGTVSDLGGVPAAREASATVGARAAMMAISEVEVDAGAVPARSKSFGGPTPEPERGSAPLLVWQNVTCDHASKRGSSRVLHGVSGELNPSEIMAIMGGSGAGKSTLLDIIAGRKMAGTLGGTVSALGGGVRLLSTVTGPPAASAYIPQEVAFMPMQTAEEAVAFAANLVLGKDTRGDAVRNARIRDVLDEVGLYSDKSSRRIGGTLPGGLVIRGLSGGEKKRLALACALATKPKLLFLDEITSGLDSENALNIVKLLKRLCASRSISALIVIHQPSSQIFDLFDALMVLSRGRPVFSSKVADLPQLFDVLAADKHYPMETSHTTGDMLLQIAEQTDAAVLDDLARNKVAAPLLGVRPARATSAPAGFTDSKPAVSTIWKQRAVFMRSLVSHYVRNPANLFGRLLVYAGLAFADGLIFWKCADDFQHANSENLQAVFGSLTFVILSSYLLPFAVLPVFVSDKEFFLQDATVGLYPPWVYCISQTVLETWVLTLAATLQTAFIVPMLGLGNGSAASFFSTVAILVLSSATGSAIVLLCATSIKSQELAFTVGSAVVSISLAMSGGFVTFSQLPDHISWLQWVSPCKYSFQSLVISQCQSTKFEPLLGTLQLTDPATPEANVGVLALMYILIMLTSVVVLLRQPEVRHRPRSNPAAEAAESDPMTMMQRSRASRQESTV